MTEKREFHLSEIVVDLFDRDAEGRVCLRRDLPRRWLETSWSVDFATTLEQETAECDAIGFRTSGTTGPEKVFFRAARQIQLEVMAVYSLLPAQPSEVLCFAPPNHIYGYMCGFELARLSRAKFRFLPHIPESGDLEHFNQSGRLIVCLPAAWQVLLRSRLPSWSRTTMILQSAGPIPLEARRQAADRNLALVEIFGSTETGAIAFRRGDPTGLSEWQLLDDVSFEMQDDLGADPQQLVVRSPRCVVDDWHDGCYGTVATDDFIQRIGGRSFRYIGRCSRCIKVNGINVSLDLLEERIAQVFPPSLSFSLQPVPNDVGGQGVYVILRSPLSGSEREELEARVRRVMRRSIDGGGLPRATFVQIPEDGRTLTGKLRLVHDAVLRKALANVPFPSEVPSANDE